MNIFYTLVLVPINMRGFFTYEKHTVRNSNWNSLKTNKNEGGRTYSANKSILKT